ncbi:uncharacterized protein LOC115592415 [Sparus aurata]|uniref:uncharacterized protein LOC115592415 n=1 Tax=Sparus aurata TaxID=8175 RepID=UPI0011C12992|nr:uncharacterized protein LOC115592415 [Sparus aurata]XP_030290959.1 uncharacterized protein LOC115592415 [Sparus aurata]
MDSAPRRRESRDLPPGFTDLMNDIIKYAASFIKGFDLKESEMREIVREFNKISDEVRKMQETTDKARTVGGTVLALGILATPLTGGLSLLAVAAAAGGGAVAVVGTNITKKIIENGSAKKVEDLGKQFMEKVKPLKEILEEIKTTCEKLEQKKTEVQAGNTLKDMEEFQRVLRRVAELGKRSGQVLDVAVMVMNIIGHLLRLFGIVFRVSATPEQDREFRESIIQSADQCQRVFDNFDNMKEELKVFRDTE